MPDPSDTCAAVTEVEDEITGSRLTRDEDDELRRLNFLAQHGTASKRTRERIGELRLRDRRKEIRAPRESELWGL